MGSLLKQNQHVHALIASCCHHTNVPRSTAHTQTEASRNTTHTRASCSCRRLHDGVPSRTSTMMPCGASGSRTRRCPGCCFPQQPWLQGHSESPQRPLCGCRTSRSATAAAAFESGSINIWGLDSQIAEQAENKDKAHAAHDVWVRRLSRQTQPAIEASHMHHASAMVCSSAQS
jgi:hypothetical protein